MEQGTAQAFNGAFHEEFLFFQPAHARGGWDQVRMSCQSSQEQRGERTPVEAEDGRVVPLLHQAGLVEGERRCVNEIGACLIWVISCAEFIFEDSQVVVYVERMIYLYRLPNAHAPSTVAGKRSCWQRATCVSLILNAMLVGIDMRSPDIQSPVSSEVEPSRFMVSYHLPGVILVTASTPKEAGEGAVTSVSAATDKMNTDGLSPQQIRQIGLANAEATVEAMSVLTPEGWVPVDPQPLPEEVGRREFFPVTSIARDDLEKLGFEASKITETDIATLARALSADYFANHFWDAMKQQAKTLGFPGRPPPAPGP